MSNLARQSTTILYSADNRVMAQVSAAVVKPYDDSPFEGIFTISTEFSPMASSAFEPARVGPYELILSRTLDNTLRRARALDLESLCILAKKLVWSVRVDVHFLDHDGGLVDAACVAVIAALSAFRREDVEIRGEEVEIVCSLCLG
jgi:exosome complex component RRP45